jgi:hypothetical protein
MKSSNVFRCIAAALLVLTASFHALAEDGKALPLESLMGSYDGTYTVHMTRTLEYSYQAEIKPVENDAHAVTVAVHCGNCPTVKDWKRNDCKITGVGETIKFACKTKSADEEYVFDGDRLKTSGFGSKFPFSVVAKKVVK